MSEEQEILNSEEWNSQYVEETAEDQAEIDHASKHLEDIREKRKPRMVWKKSGIVLSQVLLFLAEFTFFFILFWGFFVFAFHINDFGPINSLYLTTTMFCVKRWVKN